MADQLLDSLLGITRQENSQQPQAQPQATAGPPPFDLNTALDTAAASSRSPLAEIGVGLKRSVIGELPQQVGQAMEWAGEENNPGFRGYLHAQGKKIADAAQEWLDRPGNQLHPESHGTVTNALASGAEMVAPSLAAPLAIGAGLAALPEGIVGAGLATGIASVAGSVPMGMAQAQESYERAKEAGADEATAKATGWKSGAIETAGESAGNLLTAGMLGFGGNVARKVLTGAAEGGIKGAINVATDTAVVKPFAKALAADALGETVTEMGQSAGEAYVEKQAGVKTDPWQAAKDSIAPTLGMTALLSPFGLAGHYRNSRRAAAVDQVLTDPKAATQEDRVRVVDMLHRDAVSGGVSLDEADHWREGALADIQAGAPIRRDISGNQPADQLVTQADPQMASPPQAPQEQAPPKGPLSRAVETAGAVVQPIVQPTANVETAPSAQDSIIQGQAAQGQVVQPAAGAIIQPAADAKAAQPLEADNGVVQQNQNRVDQQAASQVGASIPGEQNQQVLAKQSQEKKRGPSPIKVRSSRYGAELSDEEAATISEVSQSGINENILVGRMTDGRNAYRLFDKQKQEYLSKWKVFDDAPAKASEQQAPPETMQPAKQEVLNQEAVNQSVRQEENAPAQGQREPAATADAGSRSGTPAEGGPSAQPEQDELYQQASQYAAKIGQMPTLGELIHQFDIDINTAESIHDKVAQSFNAVSQEEKTPPIAQKEETGESPQLDFEQRMRDAVAFGTHPEPVPGKDAIGPAGDFLDRRKRDAADRRDFAEPQNNAMTVPADTAGFVRDHQLRREGPGNITAPMMRQPGETLRQFIERKKGAHANTVSTTQEQPGEMATSGQRQDLLTERKEQRTTAAQTVPGGVADQVELAETRTPDMEKVSYTLGAIKTADATSLEEMALRMPQFLNDNPEYKKFEQAFRQEFHARRRELAGRNAEQQVVSAITNQEPIAQEENGSVRRETQIVPGNDARANIGQNEPVAGGPGQAQDALFQQAKAYQQDIGQVPKIEELIQQFGIDVDTASELHDRLNAEQPENGNGANKVDRISSFYGQMTAPAEITKDTEAYLNEQRERRAFYGKSSAPLAPKADAQGFVQDQQIRSGSMATVKEPMRRQPGEKWSDFVKRQKEATVAENATGAFTSPEQPTFIRSLTQAEKNSPAKRNAALAELQDKEGYEKVYKPFGPDGDKKGAGFYYEQTKQPPTLPADQRTLEQPGEMASSGQRQERITVSQRRAASGGEFGANGEWYEGGKFIATTDRPKSSIKWKKPSGEQEIDKGVWRKHPETADNVIAVSLYKQLGGIEKRNQDGTFSFNEDLRGDLATDDSIASRKSKIEAYNNGARWSLVAINDDGSRTPIDKHLDIEGKIVKKNGAKPSAETVMESPQGDDSNAPTTQQQEATNGEERQGQGRQGLLEHDPDNEERYLGTEATIKEEKGRGGRVLRSAQAVKVVRTMQSTTGKTIVEVEPYNQPGATFRYDADDLIIDKLVDRKQDEEAPATPEALQAEFKEEVAAVTEPAANETTSEENDRLEALDEQPAEIVVKPDVEMFFENRTEVTRARNLVESFGGGKSKSQTPNDALKRTTAFVKRFVKTVPEFNKAPVFIVKRDARLGNVLRFTDSYQYDIRPEIFGLAPDSLKIGQHVRIDLDAWLGKTDTAGANYRLIKNVDFSRTWKGDGWWATGAMVVSGDIPSGISGENGTELERLISSFFDALKEGTVVQQEEYQRLEEDTNDKSKYIVVKVGDRTIDTKVVDFVVSNIKSGAKISFHVPAGDKPTHPVGVMADGQVMAFISPMIDLTNTQPNGSWTPKPTNKKPNITRPLAEVLGLDAGKAEQQQANETGKQTETEKKIQDFGEKIGGARKDTAAKGTANPTPKKKAETGWRSRYKVVENSVNPGEWNIVDDKSTSRWGKILPQKFPNKEEAEKAIPLIAVSRQHSVRSDPKNEGKFAIFKNVTDRKRVKVVGESFDSREAALKHMALNAESILDLKTNFGEEILPVPEIAVRKGPERRQGPATPEMFMETFAPRGIEFGNWNNQEERQQVLDHAYDGLLDLAEVLNVPPKALMLDGELAIAFGARGHGLSGAKAHYEPSYGVINLTKMSGAGSLAHEWFHSLDHYLARQDTKAKSERVKNKRGDMVFPDQGIAYQMQSHGESIRNSGVRPALQDAYSSLIETMYKKAEQYVEDTETAEKFIGAIKKHLRGQLDNIRRDLASDNTRQAKKNGGWRKSEKGLYPASAEQLAEFDRLADTLVEGGNLELESRSNITEDKNENLDKETGGKRYSALARSFSFRRSNDTLDAINDIYKAVRGRSGFTKEGGFLADVASSLNSYSQRLQMFEDAKSSTEKTKKVPTRFAIEARKMDQARSGDYWSQPHEMAARAFASYIEDKIAESGGQSDFIVYHAHGGILLPMIDGFVARPYPEGDERVALNRAFDRFVAEIKTKQTDKGVALYSRTSTTTGSTVAQGERELAGQFNPDLVSIVQSESELPAGAKVFMTAWHGTPYDFDRFKTEKIGTGEGAQVYGYGLYFAGKKEVAEYYKKTLSVSDGAQVLQDGRLYQVELAPQEDEYLLWDKPLSEQREKVRDALQKVPQVILDGIEGRGGDGSALYRYISSNISNKDIMKHMMQLVKDGKIKLTGKGDQKASEYLHSLGIRGIKYLDGSSRAAGDGNFNYVIFDENDVEITAKYARKQGGLVQGAFLPGQDKIFLVADNIKAGEWSSVLRHEGFHRALASGKFNDVLADLARMEKMYSKGAMAKWFEDARAAAQVEKGKPHYLEEIGAYAVSQYEKSPNVIRKWVDKLVAKVKLFLRDIGIKTSLSPAMLREIAVRGLRAKSGPAFTANHDSGARFSRAQEADGPGATKGKSKLEKLFRMDMGAVSERIGEKIDLKPGENLIASAEYTLSKDPAGQRVLDAIERKQDRKVQLENFILDGTVIPEVWDQTSGSYADHFQATHNTFINTLQGLSKEDSKSFGEYLLEKDRTGKAFRIKKVSGYEVKTPDGNLVGMASTKDEARVLASSDHKNRYGKRSNTLIKDYQGVDEKVSRWVVVDPENNESSAHGSEQDAVMSMMDEEGEWMRGRGHNDAVTKAVRAVREASNRAFDLQVRDLRRIMAEREELGLPPLTVDIIDESQRWVIRNKDGKVAVAYPTREEAEDQLRELAKYKPWYAKVKVERQGDLDITKPAGLQEYIAMIGDLRGSYFPRQRQEGGVVLRAVNKKTGQKILEKYDMWISKGRRVSEEGEVIEDGKLAKLAKGLLNYHTPLGRRIRELQAQGFSTEDIEVARDVSMPEDVFSVAQLASSISAMVDEGVSRVKNKRESDAFQRAYAEIHKTVVGTMAELFKQRGAMSSRLRRSADYWEGFETDPTKAYIQYAKKMAGGISKRMMAQEITLAVTGRDVSWKQFKDQGLGEKWEDYQEFINQRKIDPRTQPRLYSETMSLTQEVLRNDEQADRVIGTLRGLATLKFLGFRVSSAAINMTNLLQAVPATISSRSGGTLRGAVGQVIRSLKTMAGYRRGRAGDLDKLIFTEISERGWDVAQFNHESAGLLRSKAGNLWAQFIEAAMWTFGKAEKINRAATIHAAYKELQRNKQHLGHHELMMQAKNISDRAHGQYGKPYNPIWTRGASNPLKMPWTFMKFSQNYLLNTKDMVVAGDRKQAAWMLLSPAILGGAGASVVTPMILVPLAKAFGVGGDDPEEAFYTWFARQFGSDAFARHGLAGLAGVNIKGSIELNNPLPTTLEEVLGAPGSLFFDMRDAAKEMNKGAWSKAAEKMLPTAFASPLRAMREYQEGVTSGSYSRVYYGDQPLQGDGFDAFVRALSFNPGRLSGIREKQWNERMVVKRYQEEKREIYTEAKRMWVQAGGRFTQNHWIDLAGRIESYNERAKGAGLADVGPITKKDVVAMLKRNAKAPKNERLRTVND